MKITIVSFLIIASMTVLIYLLIDRWQEGVTVSASTCETASGTPLPTSVCKLIVNYRYQKSD